MSFRKENFSLFRIRMGTIKNRRVSNSRDQMGSGAFKNLIRKECFIFFFFEIDKFHFNQFMGIQSLFYRLNHSWRQPLLTYHHDWSKAMGQSS